MQWQVTASALDGDAGQSCAVDIAIDNVMFQ